MDFGKKQIIVTGIVMVMDLVQRMAFTQLMGLNMPLMHLVG